MIVAYVACAYPPGVRVRAKTFKSAIVVGLLLSAQPAFADDLGATNESSPGLLRTSVTVIRNFVEKITRPIFHAKSVWESEERLSRGKFSADQFEAINDPTRDAFLLFVSERRVEWPMSRQAKMAWELRRYTTPRDNSTEIGLSWSVNFKF